MAEEIIKELTPNKASDIPITVLKRISSITSPILAKFYNTFMSFGTFPSVLKTGIVSPVYKKGNPQQFYNYRPISTLSIFSKLFEKLIYKRIYSFLIAKNILYDKQFGFRKNHSTSHAINYSVKGGGFTLIFFVKLGFEIAVDQLTRTGDQTFEGVMS